MSVGSVALRPEFFLGVPVDEVVALDVEEPEAVEAEVVALLAALLTAELDVCDWADARPRSMTMRAKRL